MSDYQPKKGDRVRVVLEGEVSALCVDGPSFDLADFNRINPNKSHVVSVEKIGPKLPTKPGSVVRAENGAHFILTTLEAWRSGYGERWPDEFRNEHFQVIYDAGAES